MTKTNKISTTNIKIILCFAIIFTYGTLLLMVGYTQTGLADVLFPTKHSNMVYLLLPQSFGLIISTLIISKLLSKINIRYIFTGGMLLAVAMLLLISNIDNFSNNTTVLIVLFALFSLLLGIGIGPTSPLISTYLSAIYSGQKRTTMLSVTNGIYGIGAGIIPLFASAAIIKLSNQNFDATRFFYYIAAAMAAMAAIAGYFINYKHSEQITSSKIIDKQQTSFSIVKPLIFAVTIMSFYMISETIANYMFVNVAKDARSINTNDTLITAMQGFGLFVMVQGIWRTLSGLFVTPHVRKRYFIIVSGLVMLTAFAWILGGGLRHTYGIYIIAILFGLGIGNLWPAIFSYAIDIDERRASYIGMIINIISMLWIPITQLILALIWTQHDAGVNSGPLYYAPIILGVVCSIGMVVFLFISIPLHTKLKKQYKHVITRGKNKQT